MAEKEWIGLTVLGKVIGTHTGWDEIENCHLFFYNFIPNAIGMNFIRGDQVCADYETEGFSIDFNNGKVAVQIGDGMVEIENPDWSVFNKE